MGSYGIDGKINIEELNNNLKNVEGLISGLPIENLPATVVVDGYNVTIDGNGKVMIEDNNNENGETGNIPTPPKEEITDYVKVGDYVNYNPTVTTKDGTALVEASKLSYVSPIGNATTHGNGQSEQNFTATADTKWRVLSIENGTVELISENVIKTNANENFKLKGAIGYLYAEQELNEVCKIFGYGYGADPTKGGTYTTGGPIDTPSTGKIEGTGARSITIEDVNKKAGITEADYVTINSNYGKTTYPTSNIYYPTVDTTKGNSATGVSNSAGVKNLKYTYYSYNKSKIKNTDIQNMLFNGNYWFASRGIDADSGRALFRVRGVNGDSTNTPDLCYGNASSLHEYPGNDLHGIRPIVTLKSNIIDVDTNYSTEGVWKLK